MRRAAIERDVTVCDQPILSKLGTVHKTDITMMGGQEAGGNSYSRKIKTLEF